MSAGWNERRRALLDRLQAIGGAGRAEGEPSDRLRLGYFPISDHLRMLDPEVVLIVGPRGAGKTEVARILTDTELGSAVARFAPAIRLPRGGSEWRKGHPLGREGFDVAGLSRYLVGERACPERARELWFAYLVRALRDQIDEAGLRQLDPVLTTQGGDVERNLAAFRESGSEPLLALDRLDARLEREQRYLFVTYDELDVLGGGDWPLMEGAIRGLVAFWAAYARRWQRLRAKIFLRTDLYDRHATAGGADLAKLAAGRIDLSWSDRDLYGMLLKRMANVDPELQSYLARANLEIKWVDDAELGRIPELGSWYEARPVIARMVGPYMGADRKKGLVHRWLLDHVRDGRGRALPRPFVRLVEEAARIQRGRQESPREPRLLDPASLRRALDRVSEEHVVQARDEWPWLDFVKTRLTGQLVPWDRERDVIDLLDRVPDPDNRIMRLPFSGREFLDYLIELGILRRRSDGRVDVPDLFLHGLGLKRKGGVRRS